MSVTIIAGAVSLYFSVFNIMTSHLVNVPCCGTVPLCGTRFHLYTGSCAKWPLFPIGEVLAPAFEKRLLIDDKAHIQHGRVNLTCPVRLGVQGLGQQGWWFPSGLSLLWGKLGHGSSGQWVSQGSSGWGATY